MPILSLAMKMKRILNRQDKSRCPEQTQPLQNSETGHGTHKA